MAYGEVLIPPSVKPESPSDFAPIDDQTVEFRPAFSRGQTQRQTWGDPLWGLRMRYRGLSQTDRALLKAALSEVRGKGLNVRVALGIPLRGSFPATELLTNGDFRSDTTGWVAGGSASITVSDAVLRITRTAYNLSSGGNATASTASLTAYAPYAARAFSSASSRSTTAVAGPVLYDNAANGVSSYGALGLRSAVLIPLTTGAGSVALTDYPEGSSTYDIAGSWTAFQWCSVVRCILVDGSPNGLLQSDVFDNAAWTKTNATITANDTAAPNGTTTADALVEDTTNGNHGVSQSMTVASSALDLSASVRVKAGTRSWAVLSITDATAHSVDAYLNLSTGALGSLVTSGSNVTNPRSFVVDEGNGWYRFHLVVRKSGSQTTMHAYAGAASANSTGSYAGTAAAKAIYLWRGGMAVSSLPFIPGQTTSSAISTTTQTGASINVKGLPVSTSGLLLPGDLIEINGEMKRVTSRLDSDAAGTGVLKFRPGLAAVAADNDPVFVNSIGRFMIQSVQERDSYGLYTDFDLDLIEAPQ